MTFGCRFLITFTMDAETVRSDFAEKGTVAYYARAVTRVGLWRSEERMLTQVFEPTDTLLELGCGAGRVSIGLWELGYERLLGVDFCRPMVAEARRISRLLEYGISFRQGDATSLDLEDASFDGAFFMFNGLMQIPGRENRRRAFREIYRVVRPGGRFVFTTHDRANPRYKDFWEGESERWEAGQQDSRLDDFGDKYFESAEGRIFMHIPSREEIVEDLEANGWRRVEDVWRIEIANEPPEVREFSDECRFWVAERPENE